VRRGRNLGERSLLDTSTTRITPGPAGGGVHVSAWLVVTGGDEAAQYDSSLPRPRLRDGEVLERWLAQQPEYRQDAGLWVGRHLTAEVHVARSEGELRSVSLSVSRRGTAKSEAEHEELRRRMVGLAAALSGRLWDDDEEGFVDEVPGPTGSR
jgi:hypothetical protein